MTAGPNLQRLIAMRMAKDAATSVAPNFADVSTWLQDGVAMTQSARNAVRWCFEVMDRLRAAPGPNAYAKSDDETIAGAILERCESKADEVGRAFYTGALVDHIRHNPIDLDALRETN